MTETKSYTKEYIKEKITTDQKWLERAILAIYEYQTSEEQKHRDVEKHNNVGFTSSDASFFSYCAEWLKKGKHLSGKFLEKSFKRIEKYSGQLKRIIDNKQ